MLFDVTLVVGGKATIERVAAETPYLAVKLAQNINGEASRPVQVSNVLLVQGVCDSCGGVILDNEEVRHRRGKLRCNDCL